MMFSFCSQLFNFSNQTLQSIFERTGIGTRIVRTLSLYNLPSSILLVIGVQNKINRIGHVNSFATSYLLEQLRNFSLLISKYFSLCILGTSLSCFISFSPIWSFSIYLNDTFLFSFLWVTVCSFLYFDVLKQKLFHSHNIKYHVIGF